MSSRETPENSEPSPFLRDLLGFSPRATIVADREGTIVQANTPAGELLARDPEELQGQSVHSLFPERVREAWSRLFSRCLGEPEDWPLGETLDLWASRADGTEVPVGLSARSWPPDGPTHVVIWLQDLTRHHDVEEALRASEERFRIACHHAADIIQSMDFETDELQLFCDFDRLMGFQPGDFPRTLSGWLDRVHPEDRDRLRAEFTQFTESRAKEWNFSYRVRDGDGTYHHFQDRGTVTESDADGQARKAVGAVQDITETVVREQELRVALGELEAARARLSKENIYLQEELLENLDHQEIVGDSEVIRRTLEQVSLVAQSDATVLLHGETGTGKELLARAVHASSKRSGRPLVKVNCAALASTLIESEIFGHEKGAFSGATAQRTGRFELADQGTLFLDEIGEIPLDLQAKLLQVLQSGEFERLGSSRTRKADVRIIAATNRDLRRAVDEGTFRDDLYYRLSVFPIEVPALRERRQDIRPIASYYVSRHNARHGGPVTEIPEATMAALEAYDWPGNIRELENVIERGLILSQGRTLRIDAASFTPRSTDGSGPPAAVARGERTGTASSAPGTLESMERAHILATLESCDWRVKGRGNAADRLGLNEATLRSRMKKLGVQRPG